MTRYEIDATDALSMALERAKAALYLLDDLCQEVSSGYLNAVGCKATDAKDECTRMMRDTALHINVASATC